jgi:hypothetical protein
MHHTLGSFFTMGDVNKKEHIFQMESPIISDSPKYFFDEMRLIP